MKKVVVAQIFLKFAKACSKAMKLLARSSSMLLNSVQLFLILAQFGFQMFQTFAQNCLKLVRCCYDWQWPKCLVKNSVCSANDAAAARMMQRAKQQMVQQQGFMMGGKREQHRMMIGASTKGCLLSTFII